MSHAWRSWPNFLDAEPEPTLCVGTTQPVLAGEKSSRLLLGLLDRMSRPSPCSEPPTLQQSGQWPDPPFLLGRVFRCPEPSGGLTEAPRVAVHWRSGKGPERALKRHSYHLSALVPDQEPVQLTPQMRALLSHQLPFWSDFFWSHLLVTSLILFLCSPLSWVLTQILSPFIGAACACPLLLSAPGNYLPVKPRPWVPS